jgi:hypothetical protein
MKAITIKQPWASLIVKGIKDIENRTWKTNFRGTILIHSAKKEADLKTYLTSEYQRHFVSQLKRPYINGCIIGSVDIVDCVKSLDNQNSLWGGLYCYHWKLENAIEFPEPIPAKGRLSFWEYANINSEPEEENGKLFCHCSIPVKEKNQVCSMIDHYECRYCGGIWYK